jgi:hypothetical protein
MVVAAPRMSTAPLVVGRRQQAYRFKLLGNAVSVQAACWVGLQLAFPARYKYLPAESDHRLPGPFQTKVGVDQPMEWRVVWDECDPEDGGELLIKLPLKRGRSDAFPEMREPEDLDPAFTGPYGGGGVDEPSMLLHGVAPSLALIIRSHPRMCPLLPCCQMFTLTRAAAALHSEAVTRRAASRR